MQGFLDQIGHFLPLLARRRLHVALARDLESRLDRRSAAAKQRRCSRHDDVSSATTGSAGTHLTKMNSVGPERCAQPAYWKASRARMFKASSMLLPARAVRTLS